MRPSQRPLLGPTKLNAVLMVWLVSGCWTATAPASSANAPSSAPRTVPSEPKRVAELDWPQLIGVPIDDAQQAIAVLLGIAGDSQLEPHGVEIVQRDGRVDTIFLHIEPEDAVSPVYRGPLFRGVERTMTGAQVIATLGEPDEWGDDRTWFKYRRPEAQIHFQLTAADTLYMVTLMRPDWTPGSD